MELKKAGRRSNRAGWPKLRHGETVARRQAVTTRRAQLSISTLKGENRDALEPVGE